MTNGKGVGIGRKNHEWDREKNNHAIESPEQGKKLKK